jgi:hypothetical protein
MPLIKEQMPIGKIIKAYRQGINKAFMLNY